MKTKYDIYHQSSSWWCRCRRVHQSKTFETKIQTFSWLIILAGWTEYLRFKYQVTICLLESPCTSSSHSPSFFLSEPISWISSGGKKSIASCASKRLHKHKQGQEAKNERQSLSILCSQCQHFANSNLSAKITSKAKQSMGPQISVYNLWRGRVKVCQCFVTIVHNWIGFCENGQEARGSHNHIVDYSVKQWRQCFPNHHNMFDLVSLQPGEKV